MIVGVGIDIIEVARIEASYQKFGDRFLARILLPEEISYCLSHRRPGPFLAARFAAKEAISKAFGTGIGAQLGWKDIEVRRKESGEPYVVLHGKAQALLAGRAGPDATLNISLSHTEVHATAVAILDTRSAK